MSWPSRGRWRTLGSRIVVLVVLLDQLATALGIAGFLIAGFVFAYRGEPERALLAWIAHATWSISAQLRSRP